jgi:hypothetical protein
LARSLTGACRSARVPAIKQPSAALHAVPDTLKSVFPTTAPNSGIPLPDLDYDLPMIRVEIVSNVRCLRMESGKVQAIASFSAGVDRFRVVNEAENNLVSGRWRRA